MRTLISMQFDVIRHFYDATADGALAATHALVAAQASAGRSMLSTWQSVLAGTSGQQTVTSVRAGDAKPLEVRVAVRSAGGHAVAPTG